MREIKFRAWDTYLNNYQFAGWGSKTFSIFTKRTNNCPRYIIEQYTGIKDSKGIDIYEGDIVEFTWWWFDGNEQETQLTGVMNFEYGSFILSKIENDFFQDHTGYKKGEGKIWFGELTFDDADFEVKGNIHQNPELLNKIETI